MIVLAEHLTRARNAATTTIGWLIRIVQDDRARDGVATVLVDGAGCNPLRCLRKH
jgi:hypothetical protein